MKYSIVIPTYNHCDDLLKPCIQSIIKYSTLLNTEIVVVANGCTDGTRNYVESLGSNFKLVWSDEALGYTKAANLGIKNSLGDYVILLNNDTEILPSAPDHWLETLNEPFINNPKMTLTGSLKLFDHDIQREFIVFCCAMIRRSAFDNLGFLDEIFNPGYGEDIDFAMRIEAAGLQWKCIDETKFINGTNIGSFPLWHKNNKTFGEIAEYGSIVGRNRQILIDRYAKPPTLKYSIVIPTYNHCSDYLQPCLESIKKYTDLSIVEVIVVANGCTDGTREYVESLGNPFKLIWRDEPLGYTIATNLGIKEARGEYVVLLNNDVILLEQTTNLWLELLENPFKADPKTGITGPMKFSWDCGGVIRESMAFWLVMMRRSLFSEIGLLDEIFSPGMGEDGDFSVKTVEAGYNLVSYDQPFAFESGPIKTQFPIWHKGNGTFADNNDHKNSVIDRNNRILAYRWGLQSKKHIEVSIVIPTAHNFHNALKPCLEAIFTYTDLSDKEIIVVPNGSTQEAREYLNEHTDKLTYIWSDKPTGVVRAYNAGINASRGKYIVTIDDDSILMAQERDTWINILKKPFLEEERVGATGPFAHEYEGLGFVIHSGCTMYDAELLKRIGGFDEEFNPGYFSDPDVSLRIWEQGYRCVEVPVDRANKNYTGTVFSVNFPVVHMGTVQTMNKNADIAIVAANREKLYLRHSKKMISKNLEDMYQYICTLDYDTKEHIPTLRKYAEECDHITEFGTRFVVSTYGLLAGKPKRLLTYDIVPDPAIWRAATLAKENNIELGFVEKNVLQTVIETTDLLFVDTLHNYAQLKKELELHADKVKKYIICHDTETYGYKDQMGDGPGLMQAINEFLAANPVWSMKEKYTNCNGLVVLQRSAVEILPEVKNTDRKVKYSIVIPTYNHCDDLLKPCIESIKKYSTLDNLEVVVVANGCVDDTRSYVERLGTWAKLIWVDEAIGYTKATNLGIKASTGDYIVLLNNDTELLPQTPDTWLNILNEPFKEADVGLTGPLQLYDNYAGSNALIFFCVMVSRKLFSEIGILDEIFTPGGGEDIDFTVRANLAGYRSICISDTRYSTEAGTNVGQFPIWHKDNRTFRDIEEYGRYIVKRNGLINCKRFNKNIKLNLGSGGIDYPGYLSVDLHDKRALIHMDITKLDFDDNSVSEILASHVFEHLNPYHALDILKDWLRVLKPGGKLVMEMPDLERLCARFAAADTGTRYGIANVIYGSVNTTGEGGPDNITSPHLFGWWPQSLWDHLTNAGFTGIVFMEEQIPHPMDNLRVEAIKPL